MYLKCPIANSLLILGVVGGHTDDGEDDRDTKQENGRRERKSWWCTQNMRFSLSSPLRPYSVFLLSGASQSNARI